MPLAPEWTIAADRGTCTLDGQVRDRRIYLNSAATAFPRAPGVAEAVYQALLEIPQHPGRAVGRARDAVDTCRRQLAALLGADGPDRIVLTANATHALNLAIWGVGGVRPGTCITTTNEHNSVLRPLRHMTDRFGVDLAIIRCDAHGHFDEAAFDQALGEQPALVVMNHASNVTGRVFDVAPWLARARDAGAVTLLDASQSLGHVPVDAARLGADMVAFTGHKGLHGPPGTGGLYVSPQIELEQVIVGGTGIHSDLDRHPTAMPLRLEAGTADLPALCGLAAALEWVGQRDAAFEQRASSLGEQLRRQLADTPGVRVYDGEGPATRTGIVSFRIGHWAVEEAGYALEESFGVICRTGLHCAPLIHRCIASHPEGTIRLSVSGFTRDSDVDAAVAAVRRLAR